MVASFSVAQTIGAPSIIGLTDTSTGTFDPAITVRQVFLVDANGNYITAAGSSTTSAHTTWPVANSSVSIDCLPVDIALSITVLWLNVSGATLYTSTALYDFTQYGLLGSFALTQQLSAAPATIQDNNYWLNRMILRCNIDDADNAVTIGGNIGIAQAALDRETYMLANQNNFF